MPRAAAQLMSWHVMLFNVLLVTSCGYALWRGGPPERIVGGSLVLAALTTNLSYSPVATRFQAVETGLLATDLILFAVLVGVALRADRGWPLAVAALQFDTVGAHLIKAIDVDVIKVTYALMISAWSYPMVVLLAIGTWRHRQRLAKQGSDLAWMIRKGGEQHGMFGDR
jgi:signal transduction histidine kinase